MLQLVLDSHLIIYRMRVSQGEIGATFRGDRGPISEKKIPQLLDLQLTKYGPRSDLFLIGSDFF